MKNFKVYIKDKDPARTLKLEKIKKIALQGTPLSIKDMVEVMTTPYISKVKLIIKKHIKNNK